MKENNRFKIPKLNFFMKEIFLWLTLLFLIAQLTFSLFFQEKKADQFALWTFVFLVLAVVVKIFT